MTAFPVMGIVEPDNSALMVCHPDTKAVPVGGTLTIHTKIVDILAKAVSGGGKLNYCTTLMRPAIVYPVTDGGRRTRWVPSSPSSLTNAWQATCM